MIYNQIKIILKPWHIIDLVILHYIEMKLEIKIMLWYVLCRKYNVTMQYDGVFVGHIFIKDGH